MTSNAAMVSERYWVSRFLRGGLWVSGTLMLLGLVINFLTKDVDAHGASLDALFDSTLNWGDRLITAGVFVLALTPAFRVVMLFILWFREKDWIFVGVALSVMATLALSVVLGGL